MSDRIYYNVGLSYNERNKGLMEFHESRTDALITCCKKYYLAIERFELPCTSIPLMLFPTNVGSLNTSPFTVQLKYENGATVQVFNTSVIYEPENNLSPPTLFNENSKKSSYYHVFSYQNVLNCINTAIATSWSNLWTNYSVQLLALNYINEAPYFIFENNKFSLICQYNMSTDIVKLKCDWRQKSRFFDGFRVFYNRDISVHLIDQVDAFEFLIFNNEKNWYAKSSFAVSNPPVYLKIDEEYSSFDRWTDVESVVLMTRSLPIRTEVISNNRSNGSLKIVNILTDFEALYTKAGDVRSTLAYNSRNQYKLMEFTNDLALKDFDFQVFWRDSSHYLHPLYLAPYDHFNIKFVFIKK